LALNKLFRLFRLISSQPHTAPRTPLTTTWPDRGGFRYPTKVKKSVTQPGFRTPPCSGCTGLPPPFSTSAPLVAQRVSASSCRVRALDVVTRNPADGPQPSKASQPSIPDPSPYVMTHSAAHRSCPGPCVPSMSLHGTRRTALN